MKKLSSLSRKLRFAKSFGLPTILFCTIGCVRQNSQEDDEDSWSYQKLFNQSGYKFATLMSNPCKASEQPTWLIHTHTPAGVQRLHIAVDTQASTQLQNTFIRFDQNDELDSIKNKLCTPDKLTLAQAERTVQGWIQALAPDCQWKLQENGWHCELPTIKKDFAMSELQKLRKKMLRFWKRPAYLLSRRLAMTRRWASAQNEQQLCSLTKNSLPDELPLIMASSVWQNAVCNPDTSEHNRNTLVGFALRKSVQEIERLLRVVQTSNKTGSVRIQFKNAPSRDILVKLTPQDTVNSTLSESLRELHQHRACWHPLFGSKLQEARTLGLIGHHSKAVCTAPQGIPYVARSIQGETEFIVTNGRYKTLVLPKGSYRYTLTAIRKDRHPEQQFDSGAIEWKRRRPRQIIHNTTSNARL
ncbi:MAG: hypothetical protein AB8C84_02360 [Oligoflexales bacterium]